MVVKEKPGNSPIELLFKLYNMGIISITKSLGHSCMTIMFYFYFFFLEIHVYVFSLTLCLKRLSVAWMTIFRLYFENVVLITCTCIILFRITVLITWV